MSNQTKTFKDLEIWKRGMHLVKLIYRSVKTFPEQERFGLTSQMTRTAVSVPSNIAEGYLRNSQKSFLQFLRISLGSLGELETQVEVAHQEKYLSDVEYKELTQHIEELRKMLFGFIASIRKKSDI